MFCIAWPTGEFGGMGLEGSVKLGYRNALAAIADPAERKARFDQMVAQAYASGKALPPIPVRTEKKLRWIDSW